MSNINVSSFSDISAKPKMVYRPLAMTISAEDSMHMVITLVYGDPCAAPRVFRMDLR